MEIRRKNTRSRDLLANNRVTGFTSNRDNQFIAADEVTSCRYCDSRFQILHANNSPNVTFKRPREKHKRKATRTDSPVSRDLDLRCVSAEELNIWIRIVHEGYNKTPCLGAFLDVKKLLLEVTLFFRRNLRVEGRVRLLDQLDGGCVELVGWLDVGKGLT